MATKFQNPSNGYSETVSGWIPFVGTLLIGPLYFALRGIWTHFFVWILLFLSLVSVLGASSAAGVGFFMNLFYAFAAADIVKKSYRQKGWVEITPAANSKTPPPPVPKQS